MESNSRLLWFCIRTLCNWLNKRAPLSQPIRINRDHSRPQSPQSLWSAPRIETSGWLQGAGSNTRGPRRSAIHGLIVKSGKSDWLKYNTTPLRDPFGVDQKDCGLWERECNRDLPSRVFALFTSVTCICVELGLVHGVVCVRYDWPQRSFWFWFDGIKPLISDIKTATNPVVCNFWFYMHMRVNSISVSYIHEINYLFTAEPRYNDLG